jgi:hypothetical protein
VWRHPLLLLRLPRHYHLLLLRRACAPPCGLMLALLLLPVARWLVARACLRAVVAAGAMHSG